MELTQAANGEVRGPYGSSGSRILGRASGNRFVGHWIGPGQTCATQVDGSSTWGNYELTLNAAGDHFEGQWSYCDRPVGGSWDGDRVATSGAAAPPPTGGAAPAAGAAPSNDQMRRDSDNFVAIALGAYRTGDRTFRDEDLYTPEFAALLRADRESGRARVAPNDPLCMCDNGRGLQVRSTTASMPGMDGEVGVQVVVDGPGGERTIRYRLAYVPNMGMRISTVSVGERGSRYYDGLWQVLSRAQRGG